MRASRPLLIAALLGSLACGNDGETAETDAGSGEGPGGLQQGPCARIFDCAVEVGNPVTRLIAEYGEEGTCWGEFPAEACWQDCRSILSDAACGASDLCCECETAADCAYDPDRPVCLGGSCEAEIAGGSDTDGDPGLGTEFPPTEFLVLLSLSVDPRTPLQLSGTAARQAGTLSLDLEYLALEIGSDSAPRTATGEFLRVEVPVADDGTFEFTVDDAFVPGAANPITGGDIEMSIAVAGQVGADRMCGALSGAVTVPSNIDLAGSAFSGVVVGEGDLPPAAEATCG